MQQREDKAPSTIGSRQASLIVISLFFSSLFFFFFFQVRWRGSGSRGGEGVGGGGGGKSDSRIRGKQTDKKSARR